MPPQAKFTKEQIIASAMKIVERDGADVLTARSLAFELGSSARPIFTVFNGMEEVHREVVALANAVYGEYVEQGLTEDIAFKGVGKSYIRFAKERPKLFQLLFMTERDKKPDKDNVLMGIEEHYESIIQSIENGYGLDRRSSTELYMHMWVYTHGIAVLIATNVCSFTSEQTSEMITEVFKSLLKEINAGKND